MKKGIPRTLPSLGLIEMGRLGEVAVRVVAANLQGVLGIPVDLLQPMSVPTESFQEHRKQYDAGLILKHLARGSFPNHLGVLALTTVDLCSPILTYVYGEAQVGGTTAIVSTYRLRGNEDGSIVSLDQYYERLAKVSLHEVAHILSMFHCEKEDCLMYYCSKTHHLDRLGIAFCRRCEYVLKKNLALRCS